MASTNTHIAIIDGSLSDELLSPASPETTISIPNQQDSQQNDNDDDQNDSTATIAAIGKKGLFLFVLFICIMMTIGILTVVFTSPKPPGMLSYYHTWNIFSLKFYSTRGRISIRSVAITSFS